MERDDFLDLIEREQKHYEIELLKKDVKYVFARSYETTIRQEIFYVLSSMVRAELLKGCELSDLADTKNPIAVVYECWTQENVNLYDLIRQILKKTRQRYNVANNDPALMRVSE